MRQAEDGFRVSASDAANFLACRHLTTLDLARARGLVEPPAFTDAGFEALVERGERHEAAVLASLRGRGWDVADLPRDAGDPASQIEESEEALESAIDVIYQATLLVNEELGMPDFLVRADLLRQDGDPATYEVIDAKLARTAKARAVLQTTFYSRLLGEIQGTAPRFMHLALGTSELLAFRVADYAAYERQIARMLREFVVSDPGYPSAETYPEPVEHCAVCRWRVACVRQRRDDDDLSLIAGISARQRKGLKARGISRRRGLGGLDEPPDVPKLGAAALARVHAQARIQVEGEDRGQPLWEFVEPERDRDGALMENRGLLALPEPAEGDLFFDIEAARYWSDDGKEFGLQYLFGIVDTAEGDERGLPAYRSFWAFDRAGERGAFEQVVDFLAERFERRPDIHVYHYNHYEPTALDHLSEIHETREAILGRLMGRFATREDEIDDLLRRRVFVDLYRVVRQGVRASVESYSLKSLEPLYGFRRAVQLSEANEHLIAFDLALEGGDARQDDERQAIVAGYNEDDCRSTLHLRDWLEERRVDLADRFGHDIPRPTWAAPPETGTPPDLIALRDELRRGSAEDEALRTPEERVRWLVSDLLEFHRRDAKPGWWRYFHLKDLTQNELFREAEAIAGLSFLGNDGIQGRSTICRYSYPPQEHRFAGGSLAEDPSTGIEWAVTDLDEAAGLLWLKRTPAKASAPHPTALIETAPKFNKSVQAASIRELGERIIHLGGGDWPGDSAIDLLLKRRPNVGDSSSGPIRLPDETTIDAGRRLALALRSSCLPIQGPPGTGKTHTAALQIVDLVAKGRRVGVTAMSHAVIRNLLDKIAEIASNEKATVRIAQKADDEDWASRAARDADLLFGDNAGLLNALRDRLADVAGGTTWVWAREEFRNAVDVLVVDEAGQMPLADVLACARSADSVILLGDPQQLKQPSQAAHPPGSAVSALEHVLGESLTMPDDKGLFIERTRRMHPSICRFTSEVFYDDRLSPIEGLDRQEVLGPGRFTGGGLRFVPVMHEGNTNASDEEAREIAQLVTELTNQDWTDAEGAATTIGTQGILVVTPYNAQIRAIQENLRDAGLAGIRVGTVDKFQGQQAPVVIYSMATSSPGDAPRGMEFLYDPHRLNVATSRAQALSILVASPSLTRVECRTPHQMLLANSMCRAVELAELR
jgi:predicted RecB family nuclease